MTHTFDKKYVIRFEAKGAGKLFSVIDWCLLNFLQHDQYYFDPVTVTSQSEWLFQTDNEEYAAMFILKWT